MEKLLIMCEGAIHFFFDISYKAVQKILTLTTSF